MRLYCSTCTCCAVQCTVYLYSSMYCIHVLGSCTCSATHHDVARVARRAAQRKNACKPTNTNLNQWIIEFEIEIVKNSLHRQWNENKFHILAGQNSESMGRRRQRKICSEKLALISELGIIQISIN